MYCPAYQILWVFLVCCCGSNSNAVNVDVWPLATPMESSVQSKNQHLHEVGSLQKVEDSAKRDQFHSSDHPGSLLREWLAALTVALPEMSFNKMDTTFTFVDLTCTNFGIDNIHSSRSKDFGLSISIDGERASCKTNFTAYGPLLKDHGHEVHGEMHVTVDHSKFAGTFALETDKGDPPLPLSVKMASCSSEIDVQYIKITGPGTGLIEFIAKQFTGILHKFLGQKLGDFVCKEFKKMESSNKLKEVSFVVRPLLAPPPPEELPPLSPNAHVLDLRRSTVIALGNFAVKHVLGNMSSPLSIASMLKVVMGNHYQNYSVLKDGIPIAIPSITLPGAGLVNLTLTGLWLADLDKFESILGPEVENAHQINMGMSHQGVEITGTMRVRCNPESKALQGKILDEPFRFRFNVRNISALAEVLAAVDADHLPETCLQPQDSTSPESQGWTMSCLLQSFYSAKIRRTSLLVTPTLIEIAPIASTDEDGLEGELDSFLDLTTALLGEQFSPAETAIINILAQRVFRAKMNDYLTEYLPFGPKGAKLEGGITGEIITLILCVSLLVIGSSYAVTLRHCKGKCPPKVDPVLLEEGGVCTGDSLSHDSSIGSQSQPQSGEAESEASWRVIKCCGRQVVWWECLATHPRLPEGAALSIPIFALANAFLFLSPALGTGATVTVRLALDDAVVPLPPVFVFTLVNTSRDFWNAGAYPLAIAVMLFSGIWPFIKLAGMVACWLTPIRFLSVRVRQRILEFLDAFGKWSLLDSFMYVIMMVAFKFHIDTETTRLLAPLFAEATSKLSVAVFVNPTMGFFNVVLATICTLCVGHVCLAMHRYAHLLGEYAPRMNNIDEGKTKICDASCKSLHYKVLVAFLVSFSLLLVFVGVSVQSFELNFYGLAGYILGEDAIRDFSFMQLGANLPSAAADPSSLGVRFIQAIFFFFAFAIVVAYHAILLALWCIPMLKGHQRRLYVACQVLNCWACMDVFICSLFLAVLQLPMLTSFLVGDKCDPINPIIAKSPLAGEPAFSDGHMHCFDTSSSPKPGMAILITSAILSNVTGHFMLRSCGLALGFDEKAPSPREEVIKLPDTAGASDANKADPNFHTDLKGDSQLPH